MKRICSIAMIFLASAGFAAAQSGASPATDVLGAHLNYGRGCAGCHAPHNGAYGNGAAGTADLTSGQSILWGQDVASLYGKTLAFGGVTGRGSYAETLPSSMAATGPDVNGLLTCLSCHDGNYAEGAMMKDQVYETLPGTYGSYNKVPTLLGIAPGTGGAPSYLQDHPVGLNAKVSCGGQYNWDCTQSATTGAISMTGPNSSKFVTNYGFFTQPTAYQPPTPGVAGTAPVRGYRGLHHLPQPALDERRQGYQRRQLRPDQRFLLHHVLHQRSLQPCQRHHGQQPDSTVLPPVPRWRSERIQQRNSNHNVLIRFAKTGREDYFPPLFFSKSGWLT